MGRRRSRYPGCSWDIPMAGKRRSSPHMCWGCGSRSPSGVLFRHHRRSRCSTCRPDIVPCIALLYRWRTRRTPHACNVGSWNGGVGYLTPNQKQVPGKAFIGTNGSRPLTRRSIGTNGSARRMRCITTMHVASMRP